MAAAGWALPVGNLLHQDQPGDCSAGGRGKELGILQTNEGSSVAISPELLCSGIINQLLCHTPPSLSHVEMSLYS